MANVELVGARGVYLEYSDGTRVLDGSNTGCPLGHGHPAMKEALREAAEFPVANAGQPWRERRLAAQELADALDAAAGTSWTGEVYFGLSGSEVNDIALSLAQALTERSPFVVRERAYHGLVGLSRDATVQPQWHCGLSFLGSHRVQTPPAGCEVRIIGAPDGAIWSDGSDVLARSGSFAQECEDALDGAAAVIVDYTQGGRYHEGAAYQDTVALAARNNGALWIADEVVTGLGRTGRLFAFEGGTSLPDIVTMGKSLAGGASPAGAVVVSRRVADMMKGARWQNYSTFRGHPTMIHATRRHLQLVREEGIVERVAAADAVCRSALMGLAQAHPCVTRVAGNGLHWTVEFVGMDWRAWDSADPAPHISDVVVAETLRRGVRISTSDEPSSLFIAPPLTISDSELEVLFEALDAGLAAGDRFLALQ